MKKTFTLLILNFLAISYSQNSVVLAGGEALGSGGSVSYSYGQVFNETFTGSNGKLTQGVQQSIEIYSLTTSSYTDVYNLALFPNPATSQVTLDLDYNLIQEKIKYELFDLTGKLIKSGSIISNQTNIDVDILPVATYFLNITTSNKMLKSFKLIKNN